MQMYLPLSSFDRSLVLGQPSLFTVVSFSSVYLNKFVWLLLFLTFTGYRDRGKSSCPTLLFNILNKRSHGQNPRSTSGKAYFFAYFSATAQGKSSENKKESWFDKILHKNHRIKFTHHLSQKNAIFDLFRKQ
jgi:hypothetical protein